MQLRAAIRSRHMVRDLRTDALPAGQLDELLDLARRAPSAGRTDAVQLLVLEGDDVDRYWDVALPPPRRDTFAFPGLLGAPVIVLVATEPAAYVRRYAEHDKAATGLGEGTDRWPVPYWWVDAGAVVQNLLLLATEAGLGALLFGTFEHEAALCAAFAVPDDIRLVGAVALGMPGDDDRDGRSAGRARRPLADVVHRGRW